MCKTFASISQDMNIAHILMHSFLSLGSWVTQIAEANARQHARMEALICAITRSSQQESSRHSSVKEINHTTRENDKIAHIYFLFAPMQKDIDPLDISNLIQ